MPSLLQSKVGSNYIIENHAISFLKLYNMLDQIKAEKLNKGDIVVLNSVLLNKPTDEKFGKFTKKQSIYIYMNEILKIKKYLDKLGIHFIFVWLPNVKELKNPLGYEKVILEAIKYSGEGSDWYKQEMNYFNYEIDSNEGLLESFCNATNITLCNMISAFNEKNMVYI